MGSKIPPTGGKKFEGETLKHINRMSRDGASKSARERGFGTTGVRSAREPTSKTSAPRSQI
ncbi:hypothetical protein EYF80_051103 [Liparis tanakae]|uniref:Uncharacterized protein n=1 Tax=Liparis tanakae TaxID=230148 RepID=A0A4Z2FC35_9TELE|nr:hypothetical protein EYF80_051103 [Liparis tanakae]